MSSSDSSSGDSNDFQSGYSTGGGVEAAIDLSETEAPAASDTKATENQQSSSDSDSGFVAGGGVEYALPSDT
jgi:opacity protein-like surface antigen